MTENTSGTSGVNELRGGDGALPHDPIPAKFTADTPGFMSGIVWAKWLIAVEQQALVLNRVWDRIDSSYQVDCAIYRQHLETWQRSPAAVQALHEMPEPPADMRQSVFREEVTRSEEYKLAWLFTVVDKHIRALLAENLQLRQDYERLRAELEPLRQHYLVLKHDTAEYIQEKERKGNEALAERLGHRPKRAWWERLLRRDERWFKRQQEDKRLHPLDHVWE